MREKATVYLGLGTNIGDKHDNLMRAIETLSLALGHYTALSSFVETEPWGFESENSFLNCVVAFKTDKSPTQLLDITESAERQLGRSAKSTGGVYSDRIIDIDILLYGEEIVDSERLKIPHPLMHERSFVMTPLCEIAPNALHPVFRRRVADIAF
ncbi:MAG: 2-amino-4-hydroxy-6-hydroxymethyldihydropteridine diphosphokinase [Bacteroidaceae bacterium]|nr:2-amino-4-hydroxy-6-hydroxymethyldihydropteridine diphosphokinase [Bacteroidaceae bacterium]